MKRHAPAERAESAQDASPQVGKGSGGHTEIAHDLLEAKYRFPFTGPQSRFVDAILRDSYGWKRKVTLPRTIAQWAVEMDMPMSTAHRARAELIALSVIQIDAETGGLALVKNYNAWGASPELPLIAVGKLSTGDSSSIGIPLARNPRNGNPTGGKNPSTGGKKNPASGMPYGERKVKKKERGADAPPPKVLPNEKNDTVKARAELGHPDFPPHDHPEFKLMSFALQGQLAKEWEEKRAAAARARACRKCQHSEKASESWPFCRLCTKCEKCSALPNGKLKFTLRAGEITCEECVPQTELNL